MKRLAGIPLLLLLLMAFAATAALGQQSVVLANRIQTIIDRPEFRHAFFGIEFYSLDTGKVIYKLNAEKLFTPASTTKLLTEGTALELLGGDFRFHTRVYRTGPIAGDGTLDGDLVLVASGDPNLSNRTQPDGTLAFVDEDHSYGGPALPGDPLAVIKELAKVLSQPKITYEDTFKFTNAIDPFVQGTGLDNASKMRLYREALRIVQTAPNYTYNQK